MSGSQVAAAPMRIGYARVSTEEQSLEAQLAELRAAGCEEIYSEHASGKKDNRAELKNALRALRAGDTLVVTRLDRLGRSLSHLVQTVADLGQRGIAFESRAEAIDTASAGGELAFHMFASFAQFERRVISERTKSGLAVARARGKLGGRKPCMTIAELRQAKRLLDDPEISSSEVAKTYGVSRSTLYLGLKRLDAANQQPSKAAA
jgi:DNA invertase Pin-like site-specific DNA recombinase